MEEKLLKKINELYGLNVHFVEKSTKGFLSENYILSDDDEKYFLKQYRFDNREKIEWIHMTKKYFADAEIPVILPLLNKNNETFFIFNERYFALFPFVYGRHIEGDNLTETSIISLGEILGKIHLAGKNATLPVKDYFTGWNKEESLLKDKNLITIIQNKKELDDFDKIALEDLNLKKTLIESNMIRFEDMGLKNDHLVHGDYHGENVFFDDSDGVSSVFDFEKTYYAPRMFELIRSLIFIFFYNTFDSKNISNAKLYLKSYLHIYPTSREELQAGLKLYYLRCVHGSWVEGEHYTKNNHRVDELLKGDFRRLKYLSEHFDELEQMLFS